MNEGNSMMWVIGGVATAGWLVVGYLGSWVWVLRREVRRLHGAQMREDRARTRAKVARLWPVGGEKPAEAGYGEGVGACDAGLKPRASIAPDGARGGGVSERSDHTR